MTIVPGGEGYFTDIDYTMNYFRELNPLRAEFTLLSEGLDTPPPGPCCELGFGQGVSLAMHAAGDTSRAWWGTDLMATHARHAQQLVSAASVPAVVAAQSFAEFCARDDLPQFAFVGLHGVWSWVSAANRALIADFLRRRLLPGGAIYVSYNTLAAWTPLLPLRQLLLDHAHWMSPNATPPADRVRAAAAFVEQVLAIDGPLVRQMPGLRGAFEKEAAKTPEYLLHEYMNRDWHLSSITEVAATLEPAQLSWATSTELLQRLPSIHLTVEQQQMLAAVPAPLLRESVRDLFSGQRLRRDLFVRGPRRLTTPEQRGRLFAMHVTLAQHPSQVAGKIVGPVAEAALPVKTLGGIIDTLAKAEGALSIAEFCRQIQTQALDVAEALGQLSTLVGTGTVEVAMDPAQTARSRPATDRLNAYLLRRAEARTDLQTLASPVTGGGVQVTPMLQKMLAAYLAQPDRPAAWAAHVGQALQRSGQQLQREGQVLSTAAEMLPLLEPAVEKFRQQELGIFKRLQVV